MAKTWRNGSQDERSFRGPAPRTAPTAPRSKGHKPAPIPGTVRPMKGVDFEEYDWEGDDYGDDDYR
jgi:hypothetical protein